MTASQTFIVSELDKVVGKFSAIQIRYEFISFDNTHHIEVLPAVIFKQNEAYIAAENALRFAFIEKFPHENIAFGTEDSLYNLTKPCYEKKGLLYEVNELRLSHQLL